MRYPLHFSIEVDETLTKYFKEPSHDNVSSMKRRIILPEPLFILVIYPLFFSQMLLIVYESFCFIYKSISRLSFSLRGTFFVYIYEMDNEVYAKCRQSAQYEHNLQAMCVLLWLDYFYVLINVTLRL